MTELWAIGIVMVSGIFGALGPIYLKRAAKEITIYNFYRKIDLYKAVILYAVGLSSFIFALTGGDLSVLYPLVGLSYIWVCLYSVWLLKEKMNRYKWFGIILILIGVSLLGV